MVTETDGGNKATWQIILDVMSTDDILFAIEREGYSVTLAGSAGEPIEIQAWKVGRPIVIARAAGDTEGDWRRCACRLAETVGIEVEA